MRVLLVALLLSRLRRSPPLQPNGASYVYFSLAASCSYCQSARLFLDKVRARNPKIQFRDFEVENNLNNATSSAGCTKELVCPALGPCTLFVIGTHAVIGFDDAAGREILNHIGDCRNASAGTSFMISFENQRGRAGCLSTLHTRRLFADAASKHASIADNAAPSRVHRTTLYFLRSSIIA